MQADIIRVNIIQSIWSKAVLKIRVGLRYCQYIELKKKRSSFLFLSTVKKTAGEPHSKCFLTVAAEMLPLTMDKC